MKNYYSSKMSMLYNDNLKEKKPTYFEVIYNSKKFSNTDTFIL